MTLAPDPVELGLWRATGAGPGGVHALVIGISDYPHLDGGRGPRAPDTAGMGQLEVSAKTAAKVFAWLKDAGKVAGAPLRSVRLSLAPRDALPADSNLPQETERQAVQALAGTHYADARFRTLRDLIERWAGDIRAGAAAENNVAFLFFSGHGLEHVSSPCMLAQDILDPAALVAGPNAVALPSLWLSLRTFGVDGAFFFIDACRNAPELAKRQNLVGQDVLRAAVDAAEAPETVVWLQATRMGGFAYQMPGAPATLFGQALLEALDGPPPEHRPYDRSVSPCRLVFRDLESHVKQRVREMMAQFSATKIQPVVQGGDPYNGDALVAEKDFPLPAPGSPVSPPPSVPPLSLPPTRLDPFAQADGGAARSEGSAGLDSAADEFLADDALPPQVTTSAERGAAGRETGEIGGLRDFLAARGRSITRAFRKITQSTVARVRAAQAEPSGNVGGDLRDFDLMHEFLGREDVTRPWVEALEILDCASGEPVGPDIVSVVGGWSGQKADALTAWVDILVVPQERASVWLQASLPDGKGALAVVLPRDLRSELPVRLDLHWTRKENGSWLLDALSARVGEPSPLSDGRVAPAWRDLWEVQRVELLSDCSRAGALAGDLKPLDSALRDELTSPVAAAAAASTLLRAGKLDALYDWPANLADWFPWLPDGPILWAETLWRREEAVRQRRQGPPRNRRAAASLLPRDVLAEMQRRFVDGAKVGPPRLAPVLGFAARQAAFWRALPESQDPEAVPRGDLESACERVERAARQTASGGLFAGFEAAPITRDGLLDRRDLRRLVAGDLPVGSNP